MKNKLSVVKTKKHLNLFLIGLFMLVGGALLQVLRNEVFPPDNRALQVSTNVVTASLALIGLILLLVGLVRRLGVGING